MSNLQKAILPRHIDLAINEAVVKMDIRLSARLWKFHNMLNNQMVDLIYEPGYRENFLYELIAEVEQSDVIGRADCQEVGKY